MSPQALNPEWVDAWLREHRALWRPLPQRLRKWAQAYRRSHRQHFRTVAGLLREIHERQPVERVLEIGSVPGFVAGLAAGAGFAVEVVDLDPDRIAGVYEQLGVRTHKADIEREALPLPDASVDVVLLCQTLEHLRLDPLRPLAETARVLRPGGTAIVSVPQITPLMRWRFLRGDDLFGDPVRQRRKLERIGHPGDQRLYSRRQLERMLAWAGLELAEIRPGGGFRGEQPGLVPLLLRRLRRERMQASLYALARRPAADAPASG